LAVHPLFDGLPEQKRIEVGRKVGLIFCAEGANRVQPEKLPDLEIDDL
jgi:hypothetical protein